MFKASFTICLLMLFFQSSAYAAGIDILLLEKFSSSDLSTPPEYFYYAGGKGRNGFVLTNVVNGQMAILLIDQEKIPTLYPLLYPKKCCTELKNHSLKDMLAHWTPAEKKRNQLRYIFYGWYDSKWEPFQIDLKFKNHQCIAFRVNSGVPVDNNWFLAKDIPDHKNLRTKDGKLKLPIEAGVIDGPKDMYACGIGLDRPPVTKQEAEAIRKSKCARNCVP